MRQQRWLIREDPMVMLDYLQGVASERKLRLASAAICRLIWAHLRSKRSRAAIEAAEMYADGRIDKKTMLRAGKSAQAARRARGFQSFASAARDVALGAGAAYSAHLVLGAVANALGRDRASPAQCTIFFDVFGNPFRPLTIAPALLSWNDGTIIKLAQLAYDERILPAGTLDNTRLLILADALEEAGCTDKQILTHLLSGGEHYRGCWVFDALLGRS